MCEVVGVDAVDVVVDENLNLKKVVDLIRSHHLQL
jgi:hypothetical protein